MRFVSVVLALAIFLVSSGARAEETVTPASNTVTNGPQEKRPDGAVAIGTTLRSLGAVGIVTGAAMLFIGDDGCLIDLCSRKVPEDHGLTSAGAITISASAVLFLFGLGMAVGDR
jgi:hypothetical protein